MAGHADGAGLRGQLPQQLAHLHGHESTISEALRLINALKHIRTEPAILLDRETPRNKPLEAEDLEQKLIDAAGPHLRAVIVAMPETACRPGEILSLQWRDVSLDRAELVIQAEKAKTRSARIIPISSRLRAVLNMRKHDPAGEPFGPEAYVFGDSIGRRIKSVQTAWRNACTAVGLVGFQLRDLRHEAGSRFEEAGSPITYVSKLRGHTNLTTTSRYLNIHRRELHRMMQRFVAIPAVPGPRSGEVRECAASVEDLVGQTIPVADPVTWLHEQRTRAKSSGFMRRPGDPNCGRRSAAARRRETRRRGSRR